MLASVGLLVQEVFTWGGSYFPKITPTIAAHDHYLQTGMAQLLIFIGAFEAISYYAIKQTLKGERAPGDFKFDPLGLGKDAAKRAHYEKAEIKNGRVRLSGLRGNGWGVERRGEERERCWAMLLFVRSSMLTVPFPSVPVCSVASFGCAFLLLFDIMAGPSSVLFTTAGYDREYVVLLVVYLWKILGC